MNSPPFSLEEANSHFDAGESTTQTFLFQGKGVSVCVYVCHRWKREVVQLFSHPEQRCMFVHMSLLTLHERDAVW